MKTMEYLYGASVQGIQDFIFKTNKLTEVIGASEMVEQICTNKFREILLNTSDETVITNAAGNIKLLLSKEDCEKMVREFPKAVMDYAPGITISQAVFAPEEEKKEEGKMLQLKLNDKLDLLERRLQIQRNKMPMPVEIGFMGTERDRRTNGVAVEIGVDKKPICKATKKKRETAKENFKLLELIVENQFIDEQQAVIQTEDLSVGTNSFIAVVHADGNGLGNLIQNMGKKLKDKSDEEIKNTFKKFSEQLNKATKEAAKEAFSGLFKIEGKLWDKLPIRPIILGGDDLTILIQADKALPFIEKYLIKFQEKTLAYLSEIPEIKSGLTACAGIAYVKDKFPLHYAMNLAEQLCSEAKQHTNRAESGISFFKVHDTFTGKLSIMRKRVEITDGINYSAYKLSELPALINVLKAMRNNSDETKSGVSKLRQWVSELSKDKNAAKLKLNRIKTINGTFYRSLGTKDEQTIYDAMQIHTLNT